MAKQGSGEAGGKSHFESDLLRHPLCLVGENNWITVAPSFLPGVFPQLKLLHDGDRRHNSSDGDQTVYTCVFDEDDSWKQLLFLTVASLLSISGPAFSTAVFWMKQHANSQLS